MGLVFFVLVYESGCAYLRGLTFPEKQYTLCFPRKNGHDNVCFFLADLLLGLLAEGYAPVKVAIRVESLHPAVCPAYFSSLCVEVFLHDFHRFDPLQLPALPATA
jgi:hypothetical protein